MGNRLINLDFNATAKLPNWWKFTFFVWTNLVAILKYALENTFIALWYLLWCHFTFWFWEGKLPWRRNPSQKKEREHKDSGKKKFATAEND